MEQKIKDLLIELKKDERNYYTTATMFANAPLALIQFGLSSKINMLESLLGLPLSTFPLSKNSKKEYCDCGKSFLAAHGECADCPGRGVNSKIRQDFSVLKVFIKRNIWDNYGLFVGTKKVYDGKNKADLIEYAETKYPHAEIIDKTK